MVYLVLASTPESRTPFLTILADAAVNYRSARIGDGHPPATQPVRFCPICRMVGNGGQGSCRKRRGQVRYICRWAFGRAYDKVNASEGGEPTGLSLAKCLDLTQNRQIFIVKQDWFSAMNQFRKRLIGNHNRKRIELTRTRVLHHMFGAGRHND